MSTHKRCHFFALIFLRTHRLCQRTSKDTFPKRARASVYIALLRMQHFAPAGLAGSSCATLATCHQMFSNRQDDCDSRPSRTTKGSSFYHRSIAAVLQWIITLSNIRLNKAQCVPFVNSLCQGSTGNVHISRINISTCIHYCNTQSDR